MVNSDNEGANVIAIATRVRRQTSNADVLALCDHALAGNVTAMAKRNVTVPRNVTGDCLVCESRRKANLARQHRHRGKAKP